MYFNLNLKERDIILYTIFTKTKRAPLKK